MNSNILLSGVIALIIYLLLAFGLLFYFSHYESAPTVGKRESLDIAFVTKEKEPVPQQERKEEVIVQKPTPTENEAVKNDQDTKTTSPRSVSDIFESVTTQKREDTTTQSSKATTRYQRQSEAISRDDITFHSLKDVTITQTQTQGEIDNELVSRLQQFLYRQWQPSRSVGQNSATLH
ncbi:MAG: hypothetical protein ACQESH_00840, partial [Campylobacterota bacterium]